METLLITIDIVFGIIGGLVFWALFSSPLFVAVYFFAKSIRKLSWGYTLKLAVVIFVAVILLAPAPMGMFVAMLPNGYLMPSGLEYYSKVWAWMVVSLPASGVVAFLLFRGFMRGT